MGTNRSIKNILMTIAVLILLGSLYYLYISYLDYAAQIPATSGHLSPIANLAIFSAMTLFSLLMLILIPKAFKGGNSNNLSQLRSIIKKGTVIAEKSGKYTDEEIQTLNSLDLFTPGGLHTAYVFLDDLIEELNPQTHSNKTITNDTILIAKKSSLSSSIIESFLSSIKGYKTAIVSNQSDFDNALDKNIKAIFADEEYLIGTNKSVLIEHQVPIILTSEPSSRLVNKGLNLKKIDTILSQSTIVSILNDME